ncbi:hypothetical protein D6C87_00675 [Aureobasidium pullulans]|uniref:Uncharacterized protein n=1 Tax=Aureobasidium pullulans TaxID=5580 RepID=A0AB38M8G1_AURPU|nr:hypothetical protein D6C94_01375 [Aureobasidium pullulans]THZ48496.1 hypothetical protein D6C87_00675 [Aureobasidium pullulans]THZ91837.1 hypothetical protein D6C88_03437 [Aureobasidium pullulans]
METQKRKSDDDATKDAGSQDRMKKARVEQPEPPLSVYQIYEDTAKALRSSIQELNVATNKPHSTTDTDDYARTAIAYLPHVREISSMEGHLGIAWDLLTKIAEHAFSPALSYQNPGRGGSAVPFMELDVDMLLLIKLRRERDNDTHWMSSILTKLEERRNFLLRFGLQGWFSRCIAHMRSALGRAAIVEEIPRMPEEGARAVSPPPEMKLLYRQTIRDIDKDIAKFNGSNGKRRKHSFGPEDYAVNAVRYIPTILDISYMEGRYGLFHAFLLMLRVSDTAYGSLGDYNEDCRNGESEEHYGELDDALWWLIRRLVMDPMPPRSATLAEKEREWSRMSCTFVRHRRSWQRSRDNDWVESTLEDLTQTSYRLSSYGLNGWFPESILELESILEQRNLPRLYSREARCLYSELMMDIRYRTTIMRKREFGYHGVRPANCTPLIVQLLSDLRRLVGRHAASQDAMNVAVALVRYFEEVNEPDEDEDEEQSTGHTLAELDDILWVLIEREVRDKKNRVAPYNEWTAFPHRILTRTRDRLEKYGAEFPFDNSITSLENHICGDLIRGK